jgi:hypothetical protein
MSGQCAQRRSQLVRAATSNRALDFRMRPRPQRKSLDEQRAAHGGDAEPATAFILFVDRNLYQAAAFKGLKGRGEGGPVHGKKPSDAADGRRFRPVQRHQQRELPMRKIERPEYLIEAAGQRTRRALYVQAQAGVAHLMGGREWQFLAG